MFGIEVLYFLYFNLPVVVFAISISGCYPEYKQCVASLIAQ